MDGREIFAANLAALRRWNPTAAECLAREPVPADWQGIAGTDGTLTYQRVVRRPDAGRRAVEWLGATSMPRASAEPLTADMKPGQVNGLGIGIGTGYEWRALAGRLAGHQALFVYEQDLAAVRLALEVCALSDVLAEGKLVLVLGETAGDQLSAFFALHPGFDPPTVIHKLPTLSAERRNALLGPAEQMVRRVVGEQAQRAADLVGQVASPAGQATSRCVLAMTLRPASPWDDALGGALAALRETREVVELRLDRHDSASILARAEAIVRTRPAVVLSDAWRGQMGLEVPCPIHTWIPPTAPPAAVGMPSVQIGPQDRLIVHSQEHRAALEAAGIPASQIRLIPLATELPADAAEAASAAPLMIRGGVALVGDLPPLEAHGIVLPSHQSVWEAAKAIVFDAPLEPYGVDDLFERAERKSGVDLGPTGQMVRAAIARLLLPAGARIAAARALDGMPLTLMGCGWEQAGVPATLLACPRQDAWDRIGVLLHVSPGGAVHPAVLHAAARGVAVVAAKHPRDEAPGGIATLLEPGREYIACRPREVLTVLRGLLGDGRRRAEIASAARARLFREHGWAHRTVLSD